MASDYPGALDTFTAPGSNLGTAGAEHSVQHQELIDGLAAVQLTMGVNPAAYADNIAQRVDDIAAQWPPDAGAFSPDGAVTPTKLGQATIWNPLHAGWTTYNSNPGNVSTGVGGVLAAYKRVGSTCHVHTEFNFGAGSAIAGTVDWFLPLTPVRTIVSGTVAFTAVLGGGSSVAAPIGASTAYAINSTNQVFTVWEDNASNHWNETGPLTSGNIVDKQVIYSFTYEVAPTAGSLA